MPKDEELWNPPRRGTLRKAGDRLTVEGGNPVEWFDIRVPAGMRGMVLARDRAGEEEWDQVLCLFTPTRRPISCDDDGGQNAEQSSRYAALIAIPSSDEERQFVAAVRNYDEGKTTHPFWIELLNQSSPRSDGAWGTCTSRIDESRCQTLIKQPVRPQPGDFRHVDVREIGLARTHTAFLRSLARTVAADRESSGSYSVFASGDSVHAAWQATDGSELRLMSMAEGGTLSPVVAFAADKETTHLPPGHAWPRLADVFGHRSHAGAPLRGSTLNLPPEQGSEAWSITLPADAGEGTRTIFFKTKSGPREVRLTSVADSPDVIAAAVSYLLENNADKIDVRRSEPIVAIVFPQPCRADDPLCPQSLVRLEAGSPEPLAEAAFDRRLAPERALEAALDLFVAESADPSIELIADTSFEGRWAKTRKAGLFRFSRNRPFRVVTEAGWAGCLSLAGLDWFELEIERLLGVWPEAPEPLPSGTVEPCTPDSPRHWTLTAGPRSAGHATVLLHSKDEDGKLQLRAVTGSIRGAPGEVLTTTHPVGPEIAAAVVERLPGRMGAKDVIVEMTDEIPTDSASGMPIIVFEITEGPIPDDGAAGHRTRLLAFYHLAGMERACILSGIDVVRPARAASALSRTHERIVETLHGWLSAGDRKVCEPVRAREYLLVDADGGEWQVWERVKGSPPREASGPAGLRRSAVPGPRPIMVAQAETRASDAVNALPSNEAETRYVELRQLGQPALRVWIDDRLYARFTKIAGDLELEILRAIVRLSGKRDSAPKMPAIRLKCMGESCLLLEGRWRLNVVHGLSFGGGNGTGTTRAVLLRGSDWRERDRGLASRLADRVTREDRAPIFDLRSSAAGDVRLAVRGRGAESRSRPVFLWDPAAATWRKLGDLAPLSTADSAETKHLELPLEHAILDRLTATPRRFRLISLPDAALLSFDDDLLDGLHRSESFLRDGSRGPDILTDKPLDPAMNFARLVGSIAAPDHGPPARDRAIWLPGGEAGELAISGPLSGFRSGQVEIVSIHAVESKSGGDPPRLDFAKGCRLPRKVARNLLPGYRHFAGTAKIECSTLEGGAVLSEMQRPAHQLVGGADYRAKLIGDAPLPDTVALELAKAAYPKTGHPFRELSTGVLRGHHYASHATSGSGRVWREKDGDLRELGLFSGIDPSDRRHLALLQELESEPADRLFAGKMKEYLGFLALFIDDWDEIIVHGGEGGATIRVVPLGEFEPSRDPIAQSIARLLVDNVPRSSLASLGDAAVAFARSKDGLLGSAFAYFKGEIVPFEQWPTDLESDRAAEIAEFLLGLLQGERGFRHVFRRADLVTACRPGTGESQRSEFVLFDLKNKDSVGGLEWDKLGCDDAGIHLDPIATLAANWPVGQSGGRLLAYSTDGGTVGVLSGDDPARAKNLSTIEPDGVKKRCEVSLVWDHPARDRFTDWLAKNGRCEWALQTSSAIIADAGKRAALIEEAKPWDLEPIWDSDRPALQDLAERLAAWIGDETSLRRAVCSVLRYGKLEVSTHQRPIFSASVPCFGLALARGSEPLATRFRRTGAGQERLLPKDMAWLARRFVAVDKENASYLLDVGDVLKFSHPSSATDKTLLFVWDTSDRAECAAVLPRKGQTGDRMDVVRDLLRGPNPDWKWRGESFVRATWSEQGNRELAVLSRSKSENCVADFSNPTTRDNRDGSRYEHYALASGRQKSEWTEVALGKDPAEVLTLLDGGEEAAFFAIFQQTGGKLRRSAISIGPPTGLQFAILRDKTLYHKLLAQSPACGRLGQGKVEALLKTRAQRNSAFNLTKAWDTLFQAVETQAFGPRWYEEVLTDDPRHALDQDSKPC